MLRSDYEYGGVRPALRTAWRSRSHDREPQCSSRKRPPAAHARPTVAPVPGGPDLDLSKLLQALQSVRDGDFSVRLASDQTGLAGKVADTFNEIVSANHRLAQELERVGQIVGKDGKTRHRMSSERRSGAWGVDGAVGQHPDR